MAAIGVVIGTVIRWIGIILGLLVLTALVAVATIAILRGAWYGAQWAWYNLTPPAIEQPATPTPIAAAPAKPAQPAPGQPAPAPQPALPPPGGSTTGGKCPVIGTSQSVELAPGICKAKFPQPQTVTIPDGWYADLFNTRTGLVEYGVIAGQQRPTNEVTLKPNG